MIYSGFIAIPVVFVSLGVLSGIYRVYRRRHTVTYNAISRQGLKEEYQRQITQKDAWMRAEVEKRKAEEDDTAKGKQICGKYTSNVAPWKIDKEKREAAIAERKMPHVDGYYVCLVGWTKKQPRGLKKICDEVIPQFGKYNIVWNNCQDFLQTFADWTISEKALDWSWFRENTKTEYQEAQALMIPTPDEIIAANRAAAQQQLNTQNQQQIQRNLDAMTRHVHLQTHINQQTRLVCKTNLTYKTCSRYSNKHS
ncbi:hypothetical protein F4782DRAFT_528236 [Xylaria castorea]|nr:hypothetical protein F4782DRAFT_528236 [Xylaria castorea]